MMRILLRQIDFQRRSLAFDLEGPVAQADRKRLTGFVEHARRLGLSAVCIHPRTGKLAPGDPTLRHLKKRFASQVSIVRKPYRCTPPNEDGRSLFTGDALEARNAGDAHAEYRARLTDFSKPFDELHGFIVLVCESEGIDEEASLHLRVCLDELVTNTIDHGHFGEEHPRIETLVRFRRDRLEVSYEDNAEEFHTATPRTLDMESKLRDGRKRGFGLFMIHTIVDEIRYSRKADRNITVFTIRRKHKAAVDR